jgi:citrate/tricarballylate utilization protein
LAALQVKKPPGRQQPESRTGSLPLSLAREGERVLQICNACRYCEGFCPVFPAVERRLAFAERDLIYLANLCHDCGECFYSCQYAPPHQFMVNVPRTFAEIRRETYRSHAWPGAFVKLFAGPGPTLPLVAALAPALVVLLLFWSAGPSVFFTAHSDADGAFYQVMPHSFMVGVSAAVGFGAVLALGLGVFRFWRDLRRGPMPSFRIRYFRTAVSDALTLRHLQGGGGDCAYPDEVSSPARKWCHHATFYGFVLCFAATSVAAFYDNVLGWSAPYPFFSLPVVLGCVGGVGLLIGPAGLLWLKRSQNPDRTDRVQSRMDVVFVIMLLLTSATGFLLLAVRESAAMGTLLGIHLGIVFGLFVTMPYGKFVHGFYRFIALAVNAAEQESHRGSKIGDRE